jgi:hypothetical protein
MQRDQDQLFLNYNQNPVKGFRILNLDAQIPSHEYISARWSIIKSSIYIFSQGKASLGSKCNYTDHHLKLIQEQCKVLYNFYLPFSSVLKNLNYNFTIYFILSLYSNMFTMLGCDS